MLTLHGFPVSNYYNKVKLALLEKNLPFTEEYVHPKSVDAAGMAASPLGKIPFITTPQGTLCESQAIIDYLEAAHPTPALLPADPFAAAKVRELTTYIDLHVELVARQLYAQAFFGGTVSESTQERIRKQLEKTSPLSSRSSSLRPMQRATPLPRPTVPPLPACRWWAWRPRRFMVKTCCWQAGWTTRPTSK